MSISAYTAMRRNAETLINYGDFDVKLGQSNPTIFEHLIVDLRDRFPSPVTWEPFAGHIGENKSIGVCGIMETKHIAYDLEPLDDRVLKRDSTVCGPNEEIHGMLFHPPYFGSAKMSESVADLSNAKKENEYKSMLAKTIKLANESMIARGLVAAVCRDYRYGGERIRLDHWMLDSFDEFGFKLIEVWTSEPDIVLILEKQVEK